MEPIIIACSISVKKSVKSLTGEESFEILTISSSRTVVNEQLSPYVFIIYFLGRPASRFLPVRTIIQANFQEVMNFTSRKRGMEVSFLLYLFAACYIRSIDLPGWDYHH